MKHTYPVRPLIFMPVVKFGVALEDWPFVFLITIVVSFIPWVTAWYVRGFPVWYLFAFASLSGSMLFFSWARIGKPRRFLQHKLVYWVSRRRYGPSTRLEGRRWLNN